MSFTEYARSRGLGRIGLPALEKPVWRGPEKEGITFSLLSRYLCCRERFRLLVCEGLRPVDVFNHRIMYGNMWHLLEEDLVKGNGKIRWEALDRYRQDLQRKYPLQQEQILHWYEVCRIQFPLYVLYWEDHPSTRAREPLLQEQVFSVPYDLPSGRTVQLRGRWDGLEGIREEKGIWVRETKTKSEINEAQLRRQLTYDLQTMIYLVALERSQDLACRTPPRRDTIFQSLPGWQGIPISGIQYNVIRRPLSGGKGTIVRHKPTKSRPLGESREAFYQRLAGVLTDSSETWFARWQIRILPSEIHKFRCECLDPILEELCLWWDWISSAWANTSGVWGPLHYRRPFGVWNVLDEGGSSDLDGYLASGSQAGLCRVTNLFEELS
jgi:hypothetical protein